MARLYANHSKHDALFWQVDLGVALGVNVDMFVKHQAGRYCAKHDSTVHIGLVALSELRER